MVVDILHEFDKKKKKIYCMKKSYIDFIPEITILGKDYQSYDIYLLIPFL